MQRMLILAAIFGALGVAIGAFGAHGLEATLTANNRTDTFETGTLYHLVHAVVLFGIAILVRDKRSPLLIYAGYAFVAGIIVFSGSLYVLAVFDLGFMGAIAPLGGTAFIIGWGLLGLVALRDGDQIHL
jgi:uncharacterized membrane protein YgdD (TMEM256/DUF423 family)